MRKKNQKRVRLLKGEKFMYFIIILLLCLIPMLNVYTSSLVTKTNIDVEKLKKEISSQEEENESLSMQIDELASIDNIFNVFYQKESCKVMGLVLREDCLPEKYKEKSLEPKCLSRTHKTHLSKNPVKYKEYLYIFKK